MHTWHRYSKRIACLCFLAVTLTVTAQQKTADIEQLRKDMYRLFNKPDSLEQYMQVTEQLKELSRQTGNEDLLYRAWANQAIILYRRNKHLKEIESAYGKLEDAYNQLEATTTAKERIESELRIARDIQMGMVPHVFAFPEDAGIDLYASMTPAKEVGGDLYDFFLKDQKLYVCVGDVSGKGVPASMTMAVAVNLFRSVAKEGFTPAQIAMRLNDTLSADNENSIFVTMFIAEINLETGRMDYCNAGHNSPVFVNNALKTDDPNRAYYIEMEPNAPVGLWPELEYIGESIDNVKGYTLLIYSDGLTEAENEEQEQHGEERLLALVRDAEFVSAETTVNMILDDVADHVGSADQSADLTILCLKIS